MARLKPRQIILNIGKLNQYERHTLHNRDNRELQEVTAGASRPLAEQVFRCSWSTNLRQKLHVCPCQLARVNVNIVRNLGSRRARLFVVRGNDRARLGMKGEKCPGSIGRFIGTDTADAPDRWVPYGKSTNQPQRRGDIKALISPTREWKLIGRGENIDPPIRI